MANEIKDIQPGEIVMMLAPSELVIGIMVEYNHPQVKIKDAGSFPENLIYKFDEDRLHSIGLPSVAIDDILRNNKEEKPSILRGE